MSTFDDTFKLRAIETLADELMKCCTAEDMERGTIPISVIRRRLPEIMAAVFAEPAMCSSCKIKPGYIPSDIYGLCAECGNEYAESLREMNAEDESTRNLAQ